MVVAALAAAAGCSVPGTRGQGEARVTWASGDSVWHGACAYDVTTRWASPQPHIIRVLDAGSEGALQFQSARPFRPGSFVFGASEEGTSALALDGATVQGALHGTLRIQAVDESRSVVFEGVRAFRDTVALTVDCDLTPSS